MNNEIKIDFEKEAKKLRAELTILRSNLTKIEKENNNLKMEKSKFILNKFDIEQEIKKKLEIKGKEMRIEENQRKLFRSNNFEDGKIKGGISEDKSGISSKFILESTLNFEQRKLCNLEDKNEISSKFITENTFLNFEQIPFLKNLRFFKDFFYDDFFAIEDSKALEIVEFFHSQSQKEFLDAFDLFSCKKHIFLKFSPLVFEDNSFVKIKILTLLEIAPEWIVESQDLKRFIATNKSILTELFSKVAEKCPFHLKKVLDKATFNTILNNLSDPMAYKLIFYIAKHHIKDYIDESNIHMIPSEFIKHFYNVPSCDFIEIGI